MHDNSKPWKYKPLPPIPLFPKSPRNNRDSSAVGDSASTPSRPICELQGAPVDPHGFTQQQQRLDYKLSWPVTTPAVTVNTLTIRRPSPAPSNQSGSPQNVCCRIELTIPTRSHEVESSLPSSPQATPRRDVSGVPPQGALKPAIKSRSSPAHSQADKSVRVVSPSSSIHVPGQAYIPRSKPCPSNGTSWLLSDTESPPVAATLHKPYREPNFPQPPKVVVAERKRRRKVKRWCQQVWKLVPNLSV